MTTSIFGIEELTRYLLSDEREGKCLQRYIDAFGPPVADLAKYPFSAMLEDFPATEYRVPPGQEEAFDWALLIRLIASSTWIEYALVIDVDEVLPDLVIKREVAQNEEPRKISAYTHAELCTLFTDLFFEQVSWQIAKKENANMETFDVSSPEERANLYTFMRTEAELETFRRRTTQQIKRLMKGGGS